MIIQATIYRVRVQYRKPGKQYDFGSQEEPAVNDEEKSSAPFDEKDLEQGESFDTKGVELVAVREFTPTAPDEGVNYSG